MSAQPVEPDDARHRLLAIDGGGIRGVIAIEILAAIESALRRQRGEPGLVLADYFDYVAGTSTGAILATLIALGKPIDEIRGFYRQLGPRVFTKLRPYDPRRLWSKYRPEEISRQLERVTEGAKLGSPRLKTLLLVVLRNESTDSPWPLSSNPRAKYNRRDHPGCNLELPLWQIVRASTAAPTFFPPERIRVGPDQFVFVDGGLTPFNNPALQLFTMATAEPYRLGWPAGEDRLLLVSVGTGSVIRERATLRSRHMHLLYSAVNAPANLMGATSFQQDLLCRVLGRCRFGGKLDSEVDTMIAEGWPDPGREGWRGPAKLFTYLRYDPELTRRGLDRLDLERLRVESVLRMDDVAHMREMTAVGEAAARAFVRPEHFDGF